MQHCPCISSHIHQITAHQLNGVGEQRLGVGRHHVFTVWLVHPFEMGEGAIPAGVVFHYRIYLEPVAVWLDNPAVGIQKKVGKSKGQQAKHQHQDGDAPRRFTG